MPTYLKPLTFNPDPTVPILHCDGASEIDMPDTWDMLQMYEDECGTILCEGCKE
jgi:hypothetical protein